MKGKQRRRLNWLRDTKKERKIKWLLYSSMSFTIDLLFKTDWSIPSRDIEGPEYTTRGIIPWIKEHQKKYE